MSVPTSHCFRKKHRHEDIANVQIFVGLEKFQKKKRQNLSTKNRKFCRCSNTKVGNGQKHCRLFHLHYLIKIKTPMGRPICLPTPHWHIKDSPFLKMNILASTIKKFEDRRYSRITSHFRQLSTSAKCSTPDRSNTAGKNNGKQGSAFLENRVFESSHTFRKSYRSQGCTTIKRTISNGCDTLQKGDRL